MRLSHQLHDVFSQEFYIQSTSVIHLCIKNNFNMLISKKVANFSQGIYLLANLLLQTLDFTKKISFPHYSKSVWFYSLSVSSFSSFWLTFALK